jgi:hypothetical protein
VHLGVEKMKRGGMSERQSREQTHDQIGLGAGDVGEVDAASVYGKGRTSQSPPGIPFYALRAGNP